MAAPCTHGMPSPASCIDCMDEGNMPPPERPTAVTVEVTFTARYNGGRNCPGCNLPILIGQRISRLSNDQYVHEGCE